MVQVVKGPAGAAWWYAINVASQATCTKTAASNYRPLHLVGVVLNALKALQLVVMTTIMRL